MQIQPVHSDTMGPMARYVSFLCEKSRPIAFTAEITVSTLAGFCEIVMSINANAEWSVFALRVHHAILPLSIYESDIDNRARAARLALVEGEG